MPDPAQIAQAMDDAAWDDFVAKLEAEQSGIRFHAFAIAKATGAQHPREFVNRAAREHLILHDHGDDEFSSMYVRGSALRCHPFEPFPLP